MFTRRSLFVGASLLTLIAACDRRPTAPNGNAGATKVAGAANAVTGATMSIANPAVDGEGHCKNGQPDPQNCNIFDGKEYVWVGGEGVISASAIEPGNYFFVVLAPGSQPDMNDGSAGNLSDAVDATNSLYGGSGDAQSSREFTKNADGTITYPGTHEFANNRIRLFPYDDTPNEGGVYVLAVCKVGALSPSDCKYDNFKIDNSAAPAAAPIALKTAAGSYDKTYGWTITKDVDKTIVHTGTGTFNYTVVATRDEGTVGNVRVTGNIIIKNPNEGDVTVSGITDVLSNGTPCTLTNAPKVLHAGDNTVAYSCTLAQLPTEPLNNTATVSWAGQTVGGLTLAAGSATATVPAIVFTAHPVNASATITDSQMSAALGTATGTQTFTYSKTYSYDVLDQCKTFDNTATVTPSDDATAAKSASKSVQVCAGAKPLTATKTAAGTDTRTYRWSIAKNVDQTMIKSATGSATFNYSVTVTRDAGTVSNVHVTGTITVTNPNSGTVAVSGITDVLSNGTVCSVTNAPTSFPKGDTPVAYACDLTALPDGALNNTATITWAAQDVGGHAMDAGSATATATGIVFTETAVDASVTVGDTFGALGATDATKTFTYSKTFDGNAAGTCTTHDNTATFTTSNTSATGSASKSVKVCVGANLTASKTAAPAFTRTYAWNVGKAVDKTVVKQIGGSATFNYTVNAAQTGSTDGGWTVTGAITVANPNDWESVTVNLGDAIDNGGSCTVAGGSSVPVPASSSVSRTYTCSYAAAPAPAAYTNTATASWSASDAATPSGSATGTASGAFGDPTTRLNTSAMITDTFNGIPTTLGTLTASDVAPAAQTWTYSHTVPVTVNACVNYLNTAAYTTNNSANGSANVAVQVCGNIAGGLTIGFWQNKNGQAIINGDATTAGACNVAGYLRGYAPFQDLSATATCANVASYATNIIKAANASGASMNAMLKAQMLATALDVYFSTTGLGGNKIASPVALGGVKIDLTSICSSITNCANTYANVSAAFNGATSLTVNQILAYAASQSNAGGSAWYGQVKTVQELAKNTFDAINNSVAIVAP